MIKDLTYNQLEVLDNALSGTKLSYLNMDNINFDSEIVWSTRDTILMAYRVHNDVIVAQKLIFCNTKNMSSISMFFNSNCELKYFNINKLDYGGYKDIISYSFRDWTIKYQNEDVEYNKEFIFNLSFEHPEIADDFEYMYDRILVIKKGTQ